MDTKEHISSDHFFIAWKFGTIYFSRFRNATFFLWRCDPTRVMAYSFLRFLDHTQRRTTVGRTPLDEWSVRRRDLYLTTHYTHNRQISIPPVGFEPTISAGERPQTYALDRAATGTSGTRLILEQILAKRKNKINRVLFVQKTGRLVAIQPTERQTFSTINDVTDQSRDGERLCNNKQQQIFLKRNLTSWNAASVI